MLKCNLIFGLTDSHARAKLAFTGDKLQLTGDGDIDKSKKDFLAENETTISVSWTGGGQNLKKRKTFSHS